MCNKNEIYKNGHKKMPKKKKKNRSSTDTNAARKGDSSDNGSFATPTSSNKKKKIPHDGTRNSSSSKPLVKSVDVISLRILDGSPPVVRRSPKYEPTIILHDEDAGVLDVAVGDRAFVISAVHSNLLHDVKSIAIARVKIIDSDNHRKNKLNAGYCYLHPRSLAESVLCDEEDREPEPVCTPTISKTSLAESFLCDEEDREHELVSTPTISKATDAASKVPMTPPPHSSSVPSPTPTSSSNRKFSFNKGGGGDLLISPTTPITPSSISTHKKKRPKISVYIVPFDSCFGDTLASLFCRNANVLSIQQKKSPSEMKIQQSQARAHILSSGNSLRQRLVVASIADEYVCNGTFLSVSMGGQNIKCRVERAIDDSFKVLKLESNIKIDQPKNSENASFLSDFERLSIHKTDESSIKINTIVSSDETDNLEIRLASALSLIGDNQRNKLMLYRVNSSTKVIFVKDDIRDDDIIENYQDTKIVDDDKAVSKSIQCRNMVAGLDETLKEIQSALETPLLYPELFHSSNVSLRPPNGILLHGPSGTGKSLIALQIGATFESNDCHVIRIQCTVLQSQSAFVGEAEHRLVQIFSDAQKPREMKKGCLLILDDIHLICPRRGGMNVGMDRLASTALALMDGMKSVTTSTSTTNHYYPVVVLGVTTNPALLDPALRRPGRLDSEIEVPLPDQLDDRFQILRFQLSQLEAETNFSDSEWLSLARLAKGFTGADLMLAAKEALRNTLLLSAYGRNVTYSIIEKAIRSTKPSAIKAISVEVPSVPWSSIGGMDDVKEQLKDAIELPLNHSETFHRLGIRPPRGVLLYGPPGCSKTLMARALATEGQMNFLAVKGPELLSKWLGESERALAALFRRARLASPAIIFFDEVDAIASKRGGNSSGGGERLLSQLLTELDGIQQSKDRTGRDVRVLIVCATNRPDCLDSALMRPGRIDRMIYVGVPDEKSREKILQLGIKKSCAPGIDVSYTTIAIKC